MSSLKEIREFGCPYSVIQCRECKWNYADTCNFDFDSYQQGRVDAIEEYKLTLVDMSVLSNRLLDVSDVTMVADALKEKNKEKKDE